jgi:hypothetical protein
VLSDLSGTESICCIHLGSPVWLGRGVGRARMDGLADRAVVDGGIVGVEKEEAGAR